MHLTSDLLRGLLDQSLLPPEALRLASHLGADCDTCESFLARRPGADPLDGSVDLLLVRLARPGVQGRGNDLEFARIQRRLREAPAAVRRSAPPPRRRPWTGLAVAAAVLVAGLAGYGLGRAPGRSETPAVAGAWDGEKGVGLRAVPLRLRFLVLTPAAGGPPAVEKGLSGQAVSAASSLQFQVELGRPATVLLARGGGAPEVFFQARLGAGTHLVSVGGQPAAFPLGGLAGRQRFLAAAAEGPLVAADLPRALAAGSAAAPDGAAPVSLDVVEVEVRP